MKSADHNPRFIASSRRAYAVAGRLLRSSFGVAIVALTGLVVAEAQRAAPDPPPPWAYGFLTTPPPAGAPVVPLAAPPAPAAAQDDGRIRHLPGSSQAFTLQQIRNFFGPADWYPGDHPPMPEVVARGRKPDVIACGLCHRPNGKGGPENAGVAGLPYAYLVQTMADFKNGARKSADARKTNTNLMISIAKAMTDEEVEVSAAYFSSMKWTQWVKVVETNTVPKTRIAAGGMFVRLEDSGTEPIGLRIIEVPENTERTELLRDPRSPFIAYVPVGSIKKGEALVATGGAGKTIACGVCHGADLKGLGPVPGLAGMSPSYLVRQLYDMQYGSRSGIWTDLMKPVVAKLSTEDMLAIAAYTASLVP